MMPTDRFALAAVTYRDGWPDAWHLAAAAVMTPSGRLVAALGDPELPAFLRSSAKPFQALPLVLAGGVERYGLGAPELALICSSHAGTPAHVAGVEALLGRGGFDPGLLTCGAHPPLDEVAARALCEARRVPTALHNNCSGKHAGMLLACRLLELPVAGYARPEHPLQRRALDELARAAAIAPAEVELATDGCGLPTHRLTLDDAARAYAALADPVAAGLDDERAAAVQRVVAAMTAEPEMVAGPGRFTTRLMEVSGGRLLGKEGAAGYYAVAVLGPVALGVALKIVDGTERCRDGVVLEVLRQLGVLSGEELGRLAEFHRPVVTNWGGEAVGEIVPEVELVEGGGR